MILMPLVPVSRRGTRLSRHREGGFSLPKIIDEATRFWSKVMKTETCWLWTGLRYRSGYGRFSLYGGKKGILAHQYPKGRAPDGLQWDHLCRVRSCVNPEHLEAVTIKQNVLRGTGHSALNARKQQCLNGHSFDLFNTYITPTGRRECKKCQQARDRVYKLRIALTKKNS